MVNLIKMPYRFLVNLSQLFLKKTHSNADNVRGMRLRVWNFLMLGPLFRLLWSFRNYPVPKGSVMDVGANTGLFFQLLRISKRFRNCKAVLFEPIPNLSKHLKKKYSQDSSVAIEGVALSHRKGQESIFVSQDGNLGWNTMVSKINQTSMKEVKIECIPYDDLDFSHLEPFGLIKIDVEGFEASVIEGMKRSFRRWKEKEILPTLLVEVGFGANHPQWNQSKTAFHFLESLGYRPVELKSQKLISDWDHVDTTTDVVFIPLNLTPSLHSAKEIQTTQ